MPVYFHSEETDFLLGNKKLYKSWIKRIINHHQRKCGNLNIVFCSNNYLLEINRKYLNHNYNTDVISFDQSLSDRIEGDIFVSIDQVEINAKELKIDFYDELCRVIIHGVLHLLNYVDYTTEEKGRMTEAENWALNVLRGLENGEII